MGYNITMNETTFNRSAVTTEELNTFVAAISDKVYTNGQTRFPSCDINWSIITVEVGVKYARLVQTGTHGCTSRSAYAFIDLTNGDILKSAGWKTPAKHARGNIRVGDASNWFNGALTAYGARYLKG